MASTASAAPWWPLAVHIGCAVLLVVAILLISHVLGGRRAGRRRGAAAEPYESGIAATGSARVRLSVKYYLVAVIFVVFDLEVAFLVAWALAARELGWGGYVAACVFIGVLAVALVYLWRLGALDWGTSARRRPTRT